MDHPDSPYMAAAWHAPGALTPHEARQRDEKQRDNLLRLVTDWYRSSEDLAAAGYHLPDPAA